MTEASTLPDLLSRGTRFDLIYASWSAFPTPVLRPFCTVINALGHFIFTVCTHTATRELWRHRYLTSFRILRFVPVYANFERESATRRKGGGREKGKRENERPFSIHLPARTIVRKIITVFTGESTLPWQNRLSCSFAFSTRDSFHVRLFSHVSSGYVYLCSCACLRRNSPKNFVSQSSRAIFVERFERSDFRRKRIKYLLCTKI